VAARRRALEVGGQLTGSPRLVGGKVGNLLGGLLLLLDNRLVAGAAAEGRHALPLLAEHKFDEGVTLRDLTELIQDLVLVRVGCVTLRAGWPEHLQRQRPPAHLAWVLRRLYRA